MPKKVMKASLIQCKLIGKLERVLCNLVDFLFQVMSEENRINPVIL